MTSSRILLLKFANKCRKLFLKIKDDLQVVLLLACFMGLPVRPAIQIAQAKVVKNPDLLLSLDCFKVCITHRLS